MVEYIMMEDSDNQDQQIQSAAREKIAHRRLPLLGLVLGGSGLLALLLGQDPGSGGPLVILLFLFSLFLLFTALTALLVQIAIKMLHRKQFLAPKLLYISIVIAVGGIFLVGLQTLGQLQTIDIILVILFEAVLNFYLIRRF